MDSMDRRLVSLLQADARLTYEELGKSVGLSAAAAYQRVRKLEDAEVLYGYHARVDPARVGKPLLVFLHVQPGSATELPELLALWQESAEVLECHAVAGDVGYLIKVRLRDLDALRPHLEAARRAGCVVRAHPVTATVFERWSIPAV